MNHTQAYDTHAAERYLLGELSAEEAEDFERHYFECAHCAMAVESGTEFIENARAVYGEEREPTPAQRVKASASVNSRQAWWRSPAFALPLAAAILFGAVALYQGTVLLPGMRQAVESARALPAFQLIGASRGEATPLRIPAGTPSFALSMDVPPDAHFGQYACVFSSGGKTSFRVVAPAPAAGQPITILVPVKGLTSGNSEVTVYGVAPDGRQADKISTYSFDLQIGNLQIGSSN